MTKPVAVFRSRVIGDSRHAVRLDENSHLVLFPSFSRYITSWHDVLIRGTRCYAVGQNGRLNGCEACTRP